MQRQLLNNNRCKKDRRRGREGTTLLISPPNFPSPSDPPLPAPPPSLLSFPPLLSPVPFPPPSSFPREPLLFSPPPSLKVLFSLSGPSKACLPGAHSSSEPEAQNLLIKGKGRETLTLLFSFPYVQQEWGLRWCAISKEREVVLQLGKRRE